MRITIKGFLSVREAIGGTGEIELDMEKSTMREALIELSNRHEQVRELIFDSRTQDFTPYYQILLNGRHYRHFKDRLDTELQEGDWLAVFPTVMGE